MIRMIRIAILLVIPLLFWGGAHVAPDLMESDNLKLLTAVVTFLWGLDFFFFQRLGSLTNLNSVGSKNLAILEERFKQIRSRVWYMAAVCCACSALIWFITSSNVIQSATVVALLIGGLFAICVQYIAVFPFWFNELQEFQDKLKVREAEKSKQESALKQMADAAKVKS